MQIRQYLVGVCSLVAATVVAGLCCGPHVLAADVKDSPANARQVYRLSAADQQAAQKSAQEAAEQAPNADGVLVGSFARARAFDPAFQAAQAEFESARLQATATLFAFMPTFRYSESILEFENRSRITRAVVVPVFSMDKIGTFRESDSRASQAMSNLRLREYDLASRFIKATADYVRAIDSLRTNEARIDTLLSEADRAKKEYELGQGTITDMRDTQVRLDQARATQLSVLARKRTAARTLESITGQTPVESHYVLKRGVKSFRLAPLEQAVNQAVGNNYNLMNAYSSLRLAELDYFKAKGAFLPEVNYQISESKRGDSTIDSTGLTVNFPLAAGGVFRAMSSAAGIEKAKAGVRQAEQQVQVDVERFHTLVDAGLNEVNIRLQAIESAALSVVANEKSFRGGVRTRVDVLNSVQTEYQVREDYINSLTALAENILGLGVQTGLAPEDIIQGIQRLFFE